MPGARCVESMLRHHVESWPKSFLLTPEMKGLRSLEYDGWKYSLELYLYWTVKDYVWCFCSDMTSGLSQNDSISFAFSLKQPKLLNLSITCGPWPGYIILFSAVPEPCKVHLAAIRGMHQEFQCVRRGQLQVRPCVSGDWVSNRSHGKLLDWNTVSDLPLR